MAEDFVAKARRFYPKGEEDDDDEPTPGLPLLLSRANRDGEEDELDDDEGSGVEAEEDIFGGKSLD